MREINQTQVMQKLSYLLGELSVPTSGVDDRYSFIQSTLDEAWQEYDWPFSWSSATLTFTNGVAPLPADYEVNTKFDLRLTASGSGDDQVYSEVPYNEQDDYAQGTYKYWLTSNASRSLVNTKDTATSLSVYYKTVPPTINASISAPFPDPMVIAQGALRFVRVGENPIADIAQEESIFKQGLERVWAQYNRNKPHSKRLSRSNQYGHFTGKVVR